MRHPFALPTSICLSLLLTTASACKKSGGQGGAATPEPPSQTPVQVQTEEVALVDAPEVLRLAGTLRGSKETDLAANVSGRVLRTAVDRGTEVKAGQVLAQVDVRAAAIALAEARVAVKTSQTQQQINDADCERYEQLKARNAVTPLEYDQITAKCKTAPLNVEAARARQNMAAKNVGDGIIRSPFSGIVTERYVDTGEYVQPASRVVSLAQVQELKLEFSVPEANVADVKLGAPVNFRVVAYGNEVFSGRVSAIAGALRETRDLMVEAAVVNTDKRLLPGMFADIELTIGAKPLPAVPVSAVFEQNGKSNVFVLVDGHLEQRVLHIYPALGNMVPVQKGIKAGERVVKTPSDKLANGQRVAP